MKFSLRMTLALITISALAAFALREHFIQRPLNLQPYSTGARDSALRNGRCVFITVHANWDINSSDALRWLSIDVPRSIRRRNMLTLTADWTSHDPGVTELLAELEVSSVPVLVFYSPERPDSPTIVKTLGAEKEVLSAIETCCF